MIITEVRKRFILARITKHFWVWNYTKRIVLKVPKNL